MLSPPSASFRAQYQALVSSGAIEPDAAQAEAAEALSNLEQRLANYKPARKQSLFGRLFNDKNGGPPRGLYVFREGGPGQNLVMGMFFSHSPGAHQRRPPFPRFLGDRHERDFRVL